MVQQRYGHNESFKRYMFLLEESCSEESMDDESCSEDERSEEEAQEDASHGYSSPLHSSCCRQQYGVCTCSPKAHQEHVSFERKHDFCQKHLYGFCHYEKPLCIVKTQVERFTQASGFEAQLSVNSCSSYKYQDNFKNKLESGKEIDDYTIGNEKTTKAHDHINAETKSLNEKSDNESYDNYRESDCKSIIDNRTSCKYHESSQNMLESLNDKNWHTNNKDNTNNPDDQGDLNIEQGMASTIIDFNTHHTKPSKLYFADSSSISMTSSSLRGEKSGDNLHFQADKGKENDCKVDDNTVFIVEQEKANQLISHDIHDNYQSLPTLPFHSNTSMSPSSSKQRDNENEMSHISKKTDNQ